MATPDTTTKKTQEGSPLLNFCQKRDFIKQHPNLMSQAEFDWLFKTRKKNGFAHCFKFLNARNVLVDIPSFHQEIINRKS